ncbi:phosphorylase [Reticulomyxa filosa]|uniref:Phosphorylase n=1 Tax=Reticulomyxa filosa TaxID=46433 RepID=X6LLN8_RETFI|nr:phosphorylase [Reticulomyxa filosa]|eukprot:ETO02529.1 phosphorylase [Reticulomyxa filosa]
MKKIQYGENCECYEEALKVISLKLSKTKFDYYVKNLLTSFNNNQQSVRGLCARLLAEISVKVDEKQRGYIFNCLFSGLNDCSKDIRQLCEKLLEKIPARLNKIQLDNAFSYFINGLTKHGQDIVRQYCATALGNLSVKWDQEQLENITNCLMDILTKKNDKSVRWACERTLGITLERINQKKLEITFEYLMNELKNTKQYIRKSYINVLRIIVMKLNQTQLNAFFVDLVMNESKNENGRTRYLCTQITQKMLLLRFNEIQWSENIFNYFMNGLLGDPDKNVQYVCAESLGKLATKWDNQQFDNIYYCLINKFQDDNEDGLVRIACAESLGAMSKRMCQQQFDDTFKCLIKEFNNNENTIVHKYCVDSLEVLLVRLRDDFKDLHSELEEDEDRDVCASSTQSLEALVMILKNKRLNTILISFINGLKDDNESIRLHCSEELVKIFIQLHGKQLDDVFNSLANGCNDKNRDVRSSCRKAFEMMSMKLNNEQLNDAFKCLINIFNNEDDHIHDACANTLQEIAFQWKKKQIDCVFDCLVYELTTKDCNVCSSCANALGMIVMRLNDKQLCSLIKGLLKKKLTCAQRGVDMILQAMTNDIWKRFIMSVLKEKKNKKNEKRKQLTENEQIASNQKNEKKEIQLLTFALLIYTPRIQLNVDDTFTGLICWCNKQAMKWGFPIEQKWTNFDSISYPSLDNLSNGSQYNDTYPIIHEAIESNDISQIERALGYYININNVLQLAIRNKNWNIVRYCIEKGAWIDITFDIIKPLTPLQYIIKLSDKRKKIKDNNNESEKKNLEMVEMCKWILKKRTNFPMKQIEYAIDYVKDKLIDEDDQTSNDESDEKLLQEGASFLLGMSPTQLQEGLDSNSVYWTNTQSIESIKHNNTNKKQWDPIPFLIYRIFLLFEICVKLKQQGTININLPKHTTFEQIYEKGTKELQTQLTTYWDYNTTKILQHKYPELIDEWSWNIVDRVMNLKPMSLNECCEISLIVGYKDYKFYLSLCKTSTSILIRLDNRWMGTVPLNTPHLKKVISINGNNYEAIQPYLVAFFPCDSSNIEQNKEWLKNYIKYAIELRNSDSTESMEHLYGNVSKPHSVLPLKVVGHQPQRIGHIAQYKQI